MEPYAKIIRSLDGHRRSFDQRAGTSGFYFPPKKGVESWGKFFVLRNGPRDLKVATANRDRTRRTLALSPPADVRSTEVRTLLSVGLAQAGVGDGVLAGTAAQKQTLADLPVAAQQETSSAIGQDQSVYHATSNAAGVGLANPANGLPPSCAGALLVSAGRIHGTCRWSGWVTAAPCSPWGLRRPRPTATGRTATMGRSTSGTSTVRAGLEQGFTVPPLPQSEAGGSLAVELALGGDLMGTVNAAGDGLTLTRPDGSTAVSYAGLTACDATGKTLPASLEVQTVAGRQELLIYVNTARAQGPITR